MFSLAGAVKLPSGVYIRHLNPQLPLHPPTAQLRQTRRVEPARTRTRVRCASCALRHHAYRRPGGKTVEFNTKVQFWEKQSYLEVENTDNEQASSLKDCQR